MAFVAVGIGVGVAATAASAGMSMANSGGKPSVPNAPVVDLAEQQRQALAANQASLPQSEALTSQANLFNQSQITQMLNGVIPNFSGIAASSSSNIAAMLKGEVPDDVKAQAARGNAAQALGGGYAGSGMHGDLVARDLGIASLQLTQQGLSSAESWMGSMAKLYEPGMMSVQSMFITPQQQAAQANTNANNQFQQSWMQNQINAMPDPTMTAVSKGLGGLGGGLTGGLGSTGGLIGLLSSQNPSSLYGNMAGVDMYDNGGGTTDPLYESGGVMPNGMVSPGVG